MAAAAAWPAASADIAYSPTHYQTISTNQSALPHLFRIVPPMPTDVATLLLFIQLVLPHLFTIVPPTPKGVANLQRFKMILYWSNIPTFLVTKICATLLVLLQLPNTDKFLEMVDTIQQENNKLNLQPWFPVFCKYRFLWFKSYCKTYVYILCILYKHNPHIVIFKTHTTIVWFTM